MRRITAPLANAGRKVHGWFSNAIHAIAPALPTRIALSSVVAEERAALKLKSRSGPIGLALSGGGIRSAVFNLGVLQGLAQHQLIPRFDYLSMVSGGGYIGTWLVAWLQRKGVDSVQGGLASGYRAPEIRWLYRYARYLAPRGGALGGDRLAMVATIVMNLLLTFSTIASLLVVAAISYIAATGPLYQLAAADPGGRPAIVGCAILFLVLALVSANTSRFVRAPDGTLQSDGKESLGALQVGWASLGLLVSCWLISTAGAGRHFGTDQWLLSAAVGALLYSVALICGWISRRPRIGPTDIVWLVGLALATGGLSGLAVHRLGTLVSRIETAFAKGHESLAWPTVGPLLVLLIFALSATLFIGLARGILSAIAQEWWARFIGANVIRGLVAWTLPSLAICLSAPLVRSLRDDWPWALLALLMVVCGAAVAAARRDDSARTYTLSPQHFTQATLTVVPWLLAAAIPIAIARVLAGQDISCAGDGHLLPPFLAALLISVFLGWRINVNQFSMNPSYRNRLVRCFMGASSEQRQAFDRFSGFSSSDDLPLSAVTPRRPFPLWCAAINLDGDDQSPWTDRKATSFLFTPLHYGYVLDGDLSEGAYQRSGASLPLTAGLAMAISGAAVSPNMGFSSSPGTTFLLGLLNARLGWWLKNPSKAPESKAGLLGAFPILWHFLEMFGIVSARTGLVHVSDGGHFENLGLFELLRRQCAVIVASDATADPRLEFNDLGRAVRRCEQELGHQIDFDQEPLQSVLKSDDTGADCDSAIHPGRITYRNAAGEITGKGVLYYLKASVPKNAPSSLLEVNRRKRYFPHDPTSNQFFGGEQFDNYRQLGQHIGASAGGDIAKAIALHQAEDDAR